MSHESTAPADLSNMGIDLSQMFRPSWTLEAKESSDATARLAAKFDEGDRPERSDRSPRRGGGDRHDRRGGRDARESRGSGTERGGPRHEGRREGQGAQGRGPRREGGRDRHERRGGRDERGPRPEPPAKPMLEGWKLQLVPEAAAIEGIAKQVRSRAKAYPLFELARLIVQLSDRYSVKLQSEGETASELFRVKFDGSLWQTRKEAASHLLSKHLEKFYHRSSVTTEPPKGAFSVVAQCGMSGVLLGPPNHHEYTSRLITLHASRFKNMPFELYKSRIRMMRDEALIEQWKTEQSTKTVFNPIVPDSEKEEAAATAVTAPEAEIPSSAPAESETDGSVGTPAAEIATEEPTVTDVETPEAAHEPIAEAAPETAKAESTSAAEESSPDSPEVAGETSSEAPSEAVATGLSFEEVIAHFNEHHAANEVEPVGGEIMLAGAVALHGSTPLLRELLLKNLQEMDRFPLPLAQVLGKELTGRGLQLFKSHKKIINVSVARPRYLDRETTPIGEGFRAIIDYLEAHPKQPRDKQWAALLAQRPDPVAEGTEASAVSEEEKIKRREQALATDLLWLLHQGHVIDFAMGNLQAATRPAPKQEPHKKENKEGVADAATTAPVVEDALAKKVVVTEEVIGAIAETPEFVAEPEVTEPTAPTNHAPETQEPRVV